MESQHTSHRLHWSTYVLGLFLAMLLAVIVVPGELMDSGGAHFSGPGIGGSSCWKDYEHGWPYVYLRRTVHDAETGGWSLTDGVTEFELWRLVADVSVSVALLLALLGAWEWRRRRLGTPWQFSLLGLLCLTAAIAGAFGWWRVQRRNYEREAEVIARIEEDSHFPIQEYCGPYWLRRLVGVKHLGVFYRVVAVDFDSATDDEILDNVRPDLNALSHCRGVNLGSARISGAGIGMLSGVRRLQWLSLIGANVTDADLRNLKELVNLAWLDLECTGITDAGICHVGQLHRLEALYLGATRVTDSALPQLSGLTKLKELSLASTEVSDRGLPYLETLTNLRYLDLADTRVTSAGVAQLQQSLPGVEIDCDCVQ